MKLPEYPLLSRVFFLEKKPTYSRYIHLKKAIEYIDFLGYYVAEDSDEVRFGAHGDCTIIKLQEAASLDPPVIVAVLPTEWLADNLPAEYDRKNRHNAKDFFHTLLGALHKELFKFVEPQD